MSKLDATRCDDGAMSDTLCSGNHRYEYRCKLLPMHDGRCDIDDKVITLRAEVERKNAALEAVIVGADEAYSRAGVEEICRAALKPEAKDGRSDG